MCNNDTEPEKNTGPEFEEEKQRPITLAQALTIGSSLMYIHQASQHDFRVGESDGRQILGAINNIETLLKESTLDSTVTRQVTRLKTRIEEQYDPDDIIDDQMAQQIGANTRNWHATLTEELSKERRIPVSDISIIDIDSILESPSALFKKGVWEWLPERPKNDIQESARSLAAGCPTASVILSLRVVEDVLREWYKQELDVNEVDQPWGPLLGDLQDEFDNRNEDPDVLSNLDYLRRKRNEVNHPTRTPSMREGATTLTMVPETIGGIYEYLDTEEELELEES